MPKSERGEVTENASIPHQGFSSQLEGAQVEDVKEGNEIRLRCGKTARGFRVRTKLRDIREKHLRVLSSPCRVVILVCICAQS